MTAIPSVPNYPVYTVTLAQIRSDNSLKHDLIVTTSDHDEALRVRDELNQEKPFLGSKRIAQLIRREIRPRQWSLLAQVSAGAVHLRCALSHARGILRNPTKELIESLRRGNILSGYHSVSLQSERVQISAERTSLQRTFTRLDGTLVTSKVPDREPIVSYLDISPKAELINDNNSGVIARHPFDGDRLNLPEIFARALWMEGIVLPLKFQKKRKILVRLTDPELRSRLTIARLSANAGASAPPRSIPIIALPVRNLVMQPAWSGILQPV